MTTPPAYLIAFAVSLWASLHGGSGPSQHRMREIEAVAADVASTDGSTLEELELMNVAAWESGYERRARGPLGERGAFQVLPPARSYGAAEALRRFRAAGLYGYMGCSPRSERCREMGTRRTFYAALYLAAFPLEEEIIAEEP